MVLEIVTTRSLIQVSEEPFPPSSNPLFPAEAFLPKGFTPQSGASFDVISPYCCHHKDRRQYSTSPILASCQCDLEHAKEAGNEDLYNACHFLRIILPCAGMFEEQEMAVFVQECPNESEFEQAFPCSDYSCYESIYSEPIYPVDSGRDSVSTCNGLALFPDQAHMINGGSSSGASESGSKRTNNGDYQMSSCSPSSPLTEGCMEGYNKFLPPLPNQASRALSKDIPNKITSLAKTAGRKLAKKVLSIRRPSRFPLRSSSSFSEGSGSTTSIATTESKFRLNGSPLVSYPRTTNDGFYGGKPGGGKEDSLRRFSEPYSRIRAEKQDSDDFEDSDFYDSDSEIIRNFVTAVQPVYSMEEEPLYQYYTYGISLKPEDDYQPIIPNNLGLTIDMLIPKVGQRTLWCQIPEVMGSGILAILSDKQKQLQEAIFEILTSEVSYLKSLQVLISLFYESDELLSHITPLQAKYLFGNIIEVRDCSQAFLTELLNKWNESWYIQDIGQIINEFALSRFPLYVEYCKNKPQQDRTLNILRLSNEEFVNTVRSLEENSRCQLLKMDSFLLLPMQRITRLPLLVNAVLQRTLSLKEKSNCEEALQSLTSLVIECNEAARESQNAEETAAVIDKIELPRDYMKDALGRFIMKSEFMKNPYDQGTKKASEINWTFRKTKRTLYWLFLFSNYLILAKKKSSGKYQTMDVVETADCQIKPLPYIAGASKDFQHYFMLHFHRKDAVYFLGSRTQTEIERWLKKLEDLKISTKDTKMTAIFPFTAQREDEMSFQVGDILRVTEKQPDGWFFGFKNNHPNESGWFPGNYCCES